MVTSKKRLASSSLLTFLHNNGVWSVIERFVHSVSRETQPFHHNQTATWAIWLYWKLLLKLRPPAALCSSHQQHRSLRGQGCGLGERNRFCEGRTESTSRFQVATTFLQIAKRSKHSRGKRTHCITKKRNEHDPTNSNIANKEKLTRARVCAWSFLFLYLQKTNCHFCCHNQTSRWDKEQWISSCLAKSRKGNETIFKRIIYSSSRV